MNEIARWTIRISKTTDSAVRSHLKERGRKRGDLSDLVERAVRREMLRDTIGEVREKNAGKSARSVARAVEDAVASVRSGFWSKHYG